MKIEKVMIVDDDDDVRAILALAARKIGNWAVVSVASGDEAVALAPVELPDVILLDIVLPGMSGLQVCQLLKEREVTADIPVIFIAGDANPKQLVKALEVGGNDFIRKPLASMELRARVGAALRTKRLIDLLKNHARIDPLTGLYNRVALDEVLEGTISAYERKQTSFALMQLKRI